jgi:hypothetical protein
VIRLAWRGWVALAGAVAVLAAVAWALWWSACSLPREPVARTVVVGKVKSYEPRTVYELPVAEKWEPTGKTVVVQTIQPETKRERKAFEREFGEDLDKTDVIWRGEIGKVRGKAKIAVMQDKPSSPDLPPPPPRFALVASPVERIRWDSLHHVYGAHDWIWIDEHFTQWRLGYEPGKLWAKDWLYVSVAGEAFIRSDRSGWGVTVQFGHYFGKDAP